MEEQNKLIKKLLDLEWKYFKNDKGESIITSFSSGQNEATRIEFRTNSQTKLFLLSDGTELNITYENSKKMQLLLENIREIWNKTQTENLLNKLEKRLLLG